MPISDWQGFKIFACGAVYGAPVSCREQRCFPTTDDFISFLSSVLKQQ